MKSGNTCIIRDGIHPAATGNEFSLCARSKLIANSKKVLSFMCLVVTTASMTVKARNKTPPFAYKCPEAVP